MALALVLSHLLGDRPAFLIAAVADPATGDPVSILIGYGPLGIMLVLLATGQFRTKYELQGRDKQIASLERLVADQAAEIGRLHTEAHQKDELNRAFQMQLTGHALPALAQSARAFEAIVPTNESDAPLGEVKRLLDELAAQVTALKQQGEKP